MAKTSSITLDAPSQEFARRKVESGEFASTSDVVQQAMRQYIAEDAKLEALRAAIQEGWDSGPAEPFSFDEFIAKMEAKRKNGDAA